MGEIGDTIIETEQIGETIYQVAQVADKYTVFVSPAKTEGVSTEDQEKVAIATFDRVEEARNYIKDFKQT